MEYLKKLSSFFIPYKKFAIYNIICNIMYALFSTLAMVSLMPMINVLFGESKKVYVEPNYEGITKLKVYLEQYLNYFVTTTSEESGPQYALMYMILLIVSLFLLKNMFSYLAMFFITYLRNGVLRDLRNTVYNKIVSLPISFYSEKRKGDVIARITGDVREVQISLLSILELIVREPLTIVFAIVTMFIISPELTFFVFLFIPISGFIISKIGKHLKKHSNKVQSEQGVFLSILDETLSGLRVIKGFNAEPIFSSKFKESTNRYFRFSNTLVHRQNLASPTSEFLGIITISILLWYGGSMVLVEKSLSGGAFITYMALSYQILTPQKLFQKPATK